MRTSSGACAVELAPDAAWLPLLGAARSLPRPVRAANAVVFDFGHTQVKRGIASTNAHGQLRKLRVLSPVTVWSAANAAGSGNARIPEFVMSVVADTYREARRQYGHLDPRVVISLASYLVDAWPGPAPSLYAALRVFDRPALEKALCSRAEADLEVTFIHDGTAAAQAIAESASDAVILLGTSLGVGLGANFNPGSDARLSLASGFTVEVA